MHTSVNGQPLSRLLILDFESRREIPSQQFHLATDRSNHLKSSQLAQHAMPRKCFEGSTRMFLFTLNDFIQF